MQHTSASAGRVQSFKHLDNERADVDEVAEDAELCEVEQAQASLDAGTDHDAAGVTTVTDVRKRDGSRQRRQVVIAGR